MDKVVKSLVTVIREAIETAGHGDNCLLTDHARPFFGERRCDCWMVRAKEALAMVPEPPALPTLVGHWRATNE